MHLKSESEVRKTSYAALHENACGNYTVPISVWHGSGMHCSNTVAVVVKFFVLKSSLI